jgi:WD40 repeat protein
LRVAFFLLISLAIPLLAAVHPPDGKPQSNSGRTGTGGHPWGTDALGDPLPPGAVARLGTTRLWHPGSLQVAGVWFTPDGSKIISTCDNGDYFCWDSSTGRLLYASKAESFWGGGDSVVFSANAKIAAAAWGGCIVIWDIDSGKQIQRLTLPGRIPPAIALADNGNTLVFASSDGSICWRDVASGNLKRTWQPYQQEQKLDRSENKSVRAFSRPAFSPDGKFLVASLGWQLENSVNDIRPNRTDMAVVLDLVSGKEIRRETSLPSPGAFSPDGTFFLFGARLDSNLGKYEISTGQSIDVELPDGAGFQFWLGVALASDGKTVAAGGILGTIAIWPLGDAAAARTFTFNPYFPEKFRLPVNCLCFSPDRKKLVAGMGPRLAVLDIATGKQILDLPGYNGNVDFVRFSADGESIFTGHGFPSNGAADQLITWDTAKWRPTKTSWLDSYAVTWSPFTKVSFDHKFYFDPKGKEPDCLFDLATGKQVARLARPETVEIGTGSTFLPGGRHFLLEVIENRKANYRVFEMPSGRYLWTMNADVQAPASSRDGRWLASYQADRRIIVYETTTGRALARLNEDAWQNGPVLEPMAQFLNYLPISPDGQFLASWDIRNWAPSIWDITAGKRLNYLYEVENVKNKEVVRLRWSPDGRMLAISYSKPEPAIQIWERVTGKLRRTFAGHQGRVLDCDWSPDGRLLASGSEDTTVLVWDVYGTDR